MHGTTAYIFGNDCTLRVSFLFLPIFFIFAFPFFTTSLYSFFSFPFLLLFFVKNSCFLELTFRNSLFFFYQFPFFLFSILFVVILYQQGEHTIPFTHSGCGRSNYFLPQFHFFAAHVICYGEKL
jgi:hypothetical protein